MNVPPPRKRETGPPRKGPASIGSLVGKVIAFAGRLVIVIFRHLPRLAWIFLRYAKACFDLELSRRVMKFRRTWPSLKYAKLCFDLELIRCMRKRAERKCREERKK